MTGGRLFWMRRSVQNQQCFLTRTILWPGFPCFLEIVNNVNEFVFCLIQGYIMAIEQLLQQQQPSNREGLQERRLVIRGTLASFPLWDKSKPAVVLGGRRGQRYSRKCSALSELKAWREFEVGFKFKSLVTSVRRQGETAMYAGLHGYQQKNLLIFKIFRIVLSLQFLTIKKK